MKSLTNIGWLSFKNDGEKPDVHNNPLPNNENSKVNVVDCFVESCKNEVHEIVMPMETLIEGLYEAGYVRLEYLDLNIRYEGYDESRHCIFHQRVPQATLSNNVVNIDLKYNNLWIQRYSWYMEDKEKMR